MLVRSKKEHSCLFDAHNVSTLKTKGSLTINQSKSILVGRGRAMYGVGVSCLCFLPMCRLCAIALCAGYVRAACVCVCVCVTCRLDVGTSYAGYEWSMCRLRAGCEAFL